MRKSAIFSPANRVPAFEAPQSALPLKRAFCCRGSNGVVAFMPRLQSGREKGECGKQINGPHKNPAKAGRNS